MINITIGKNQYPITLAEEHNFDWLKGVEVFTVFDQQDSGNISFGIIENGQRYFLKYAGARNLEYKGNVGDAIQRLMKAKKVYEQIQHPLLVPYINSIQMKNGFCLRFHWIDGECMHNHWDFTPFEKHHAPNSPFVKLRKLCVSNRLNILTQIFEFAAYVESLGYVMVDFYDGSILYNFEQSKLTICDIDFFQKTPVFNEIGENFWGTARFKAPEEYELHAQITSETNVYVLAGISFSFIGGKNDKSYEKWESTQELYNICKKALHKEKSNRYSTVQAFYEAWLAYIE
ncbi:serine/threonine protein kinase [Bacillus mobilis]|uniref:serine/threonine protein kinase n=1 Tax=Bacillus mobilis TaxID=2026190 RepID=UPI003CFC5889